ncbi:MAG: zinc-dependent peptidase [Ilumatobacteraceae bacterium]
MGLSRWRRGRRTGAGWALPSDWELVLRTRFGWWAELEAAERARMQRLITGFVRRTRWEAAYGFAVDDEVRLLIAAQACLLLLGLDRDEFGGMTSVIVHPRPVVLHGQRPHDVPGVVVAGPQTLLGQAHYRGPVLLAWPSVVSDARLPQRGRNVVFHEFAHQLDMLDGTVDGTPPLDDAAARERWIAVCTAAYSSVRAAGSPVLRDYAGVNPGEFFAVATEVFFCRPVELRAHEPALYDEIASYYRQDPAARAEGATIGAAG